MDCVSQLYLFASNSDSHFCNVAQAAMEPFAAGVHRNTSRAMAKIRRRNHGESRAKAVQGNDSAACQSFVIAGDEVHFENAN